MLCFMYSRINTTLYCISLAFPNCILGEKSINEVCIITITITVVIIIIMGIS